MLLFRLCALTATRCEGVVTQFTITLGAMNRPRSHSSASQDELEAAFSGGDDTSTLLPHSSHPQNNPIASASSSADTPAYNFEQSVFSGSGGLPLSLQSSHNQSPTFAARLGRWLPTRLRRYTPLADSEEAANRNNLGGGISNDGVWGNMSVKPQSRPQRMPGSDGVDIVGGDDEVEEKEVPPVSLAATLSHLYITSIDLRTSCGRCYSSVLGEHYIGTFRLSGQ